MGLTDCVREPYYAAGVAGAEASDMPALEKVVFDTLQNIVEEGISHDRLVAVLDQFEFAQREITGAHYPYGLQLIMAMTDPALHGGDSFEALDVDHILKGIREKIEDKNYIPSLVKKYFIDNKNRISMTVDKEGFERAVYTMAQDFPFFYGMLAVVIALFAGWLAGVVGKK